MHRTERLVRGFCLEESRATIYRTGESLDGPIEGDRYQPGECIPVNTHWDRPVRVDPDNPLYVDISILPTPGWTRVEYDPEKTAAAGLRYVVFCYLVQAWDEDGDGPWIGPGGPQNCESITDYAGNAADSDWLRRDEEWAVSTPASASTIVWGGFTNEPLEGEQYEPGEVIRVTTRWDRPAKVDESDPPNVTVFIGCPAEGRVRRWAERQLLAEAGVCLYGPGRG